MLTLIHLSNTHNQVNYSNINSFKYRITIWIFFFCICDIFQLEIDRDVTLSSPSSMFKSTQLPNPPKYQAHMAFGPAARPAASNQIPGQILSSFTHFGPAAPQILRGEPKQRIRANFLTAPFDHYHFGQPLGNPYAG